MSTLLTQSQKDRMESHGYSMTSSSDLMEIWKDKEQNMIDVMICENGKVDCIFWINENETKVFSPKRIDQFFKKHMK